MIIFLVTVGVFLFAGIPVAVTLGLPSMLFIVLNNIPLPIIAQRLFAGVDSTSLLAVPFFVLAGELMLRGGIAKHLINLAKYIIGKRPGGIAIVAIACCALFAALSGSSVACCAALGTILIPDMLDDRYPRDFATAVVCAGSILGPIIPQSISMIVYSSMAGSSVSKLYQVGVPTGIMMAVLLGIYSFFVSKKHGYGTLLPGEVKVKRSFKEFMRLLIKALWALGTPIIILGGIFVGIATPTEAAVLAVVYSLFVSVFVYKEITFKDIPKILAGSVKTTARVMLILSAASLFSWILTYLQVPQMIVTAFLAMTDQKWVTLIIMNCILLVMGMLMDPGSIYLIVLPLFLPVIKAYGIDLIHFGAISAVNLALGNITPPFGTVLFVGADRGKVSIQKLIKKLVPFIIILLAFLLFITYVPQAVLWIIK